MRNKLINYSLVISLIANVFFVVLVGNSDIFQVQSTKQELIRIHKTVLHRQIKKLPPPKKKNPPPPKPIKTITPPPTPKPVVQRQSPQQPIIHTAVATPPMAASTNGNETISQQAEVNPPATTSEPTPTPPVVATPPAPTAPTVVAPPPSTPPAPKPSIPDRPHAEPNGSFEEEFNMPDGVDVTTLSHTDILVYYRVDKYGHAFNVKLKQSSGNAELDNALIDAVEKVHFSPAIKDGEPVESDGAHEFSVG